MIQKLTIDGVHTTLDESLNKYISKKIGRLDRFVPRADRTSLHADVKLKEAKVRDKNACTCEVILHVPHEVLRSSDTTITMYAAVDTAELKLKNQLKKYKERRAPASGIGRRLLTPHRKREPFEA